VNFLREHGIVPAETLRDAVDDDPVDFDWDSDDDEEIDLDALDDDEEEIDLDALDDEAEAEGEATDEE